MTLWLYATLRGVGSARELDRRCDLEMGEVPFQWICGGVTLNYHTLADFRVGHVAVLDDLLTNSVAVLLEQDLVSMERVAQDGMKVRASAGAASFRRGPRLKELQDKARAGRGSQEGAGDRHDGGDTSATGGAAAGCRGSRRTPASGLGAVAAGRS